MDIQYPPIHLTTATAWASANDTIYYQSSTNGTIRQLNTHTLSDTIFATLNTPQANPGMCIDNSSGTTIVYSIGNNEIEACVNGVCPTIITDQEELS